VRNRLGDPDEDGRRKPVPVEGSEFTLQADAIVLAIGQRPDTGFLDDSGVIVYENGAIVVDPTTGLAGTSCVYAGGDVARGPAIIVEACADGRRAAEAICAQFGIKFGGATAESPRLSGRELVQVKHRRARQAIQEAPGTLSVAERGSFDLVEQTLTEEAARTEAARCLQCAALCDKCVEVCPNRANYAYHVSPTSLVLPLLACQDGKLVVTGEEPFAVEQERQIIHVDDFCNECGNCATFCVHQGKPYVDKPRLFLRADDVQKEHDNALYIEERTIRWRREGGELWLSMRDGAIEYEDAIVRVVLDADWAVQEMTLKETFEGTLSLKTVAEMALVLEGVSSSLPFVIT
jgi:putative selenate reductase